MSSGKKKKVIKKKFFGTIDPSVGNYQNDPFFLKKAAEAKELIDRVGLPAQLQNKAMK